MVLSLYLDIINSIDSRNQREEVEEIIREKLAKTHDYIRIPKLSLLQPNTGFEGLLNMIHSLIYHRMLFFSLWRMTHATTESNKDSISDEMILTATVHLIILSFEIFKNQMLSNNESSLSSRQNFVSNAVEVPIATPESRNPTSLLELILDLVDRAREPCIKDHARHLRFLVGEFEKFGGERARKVINGW